MSTDKPTDSEQLPSSAVWDARGSLSSGGEVRAGRGEWCTLAHSVTILLQKAPVIFQSQCGVKRPGRDCKHSFGSVTGLPKTVWSAISRHLIDSGKATSNQGVWRGRAVGAYNDGVAGGEHQSGLGYWLAPVCLWLPPQTTAGNTCIDGGTYLAEGGFWREKNEGEKFHMEVGRERGEVDVWDR